MCGIRKTRKAIFILTAVIIIMAALPLYGAYNLENKPFNKKMFVPRMYSGIFYLKNTNTYSNLYYIFETKTNSSSGDPVMFVLDAKTGTQIAFDDDQLRYKAGTNQQELETVDKDPYVKVKVAPKKNMFVKVIIFSYDYGYKGTTSLFVRKLGSSTPLYSVDNVRYGSSTIFTKWKKNDEIRTTGHYYSFSLDNACSRIGGTWNPDSWRCNQAGINLHPNVTCVSAFSSRYRYHSIFPHSHSCEYTSDSKDTVIMAVSNWSKNPVIETKYYRERECKFNPKIGRTECGYVYKLKSVEKERAFSMNEYDDDSGYGSNAMLKMTSDNNKSYSAFIVGLYPWNENFYIDETQSWFAAETTMTKSYQEYYTTQHENSATSTSNTYYDNEDYRFLEYIRLYRDNISYYGDTDGDGLSDYMETYVLKTKKDNPDYDGDGIIDGLEIYGTDEFPLPDLGANIKSKDVVVEVDRDKGISITNNKRNSIEIAVAALKEANIHLIVLTGEMNAPSLSLLNKTNVQDVGGCTDECDAKCVANASFSSPNHDNPLLHSNPKTEFDLGEYPFVKRFMWVDNMSNACGQAEHVSSTTRIGAVVCEGTSFVHELGHTMGLGHGGSSDRSHNKKPNYWSVMSYGVTLPLANTSYNGANFNGKFMLFPFANRNLNTAYKARPTKFSDSAFRSIDESNLDERISLKVDKWGCSEPHTFRSVCNVHGAANWLTSCNNLNDFHDLTVNRLDWSGDFDNNDTSVSEDVEDGCYKFTVSSVDYYCNDTKWACENITDYFNNTTYWSKDESICHDKLSGANDIDYLKNTYKTSSWAKCQHLSAQQRLLGMPSSNISCTVSALSAAERKRGPLCE